MDYEWIGYLIQFLFATGVLGIMYKAVLTNSRAITELTKDMAAQRKALDQEFVRKETCAGHQQLLKSRLLVNGQVQERVEKLITKLFNVVDSVKTDIGKINGTLSAFHQKIENLKEQIPED